MPFEELWCWRPVTTFGRPNPLTMKIVIGTAILELLPDPPAHLEPHLRRDGDVAAVKERVDVAAEEQTVPRVVGAISGTSLYVSPVR